MRRIRSLSGILLVLLLGIFYLPNVLAVSVGNVQLNKTGYDYGDIINVSWSSSGQHHYIIYLYNDEASTPIPSHNFQSEYCIEKGVQNSVNTGNQGCLNGKDTSIGSAIVNHITLEKIPPGKYTIKIAVWDSSGNAKGSYSEPFYIERLSKPRSLDVDFSDSQKLKPEFDWANVTDANTYRIVLYKGSFDFDRVFTDTDSDTSKCNNSSACETAKISRSSYDGSNFSLEEETKYCWKVRAGTTNGHYPHSEWANGGCFTTEKPPEENVTISMTAIGTGEGAILVNNNTGCSISEIKAGGCQIKVAKGSQVLITPLYKEPNIFVRWDYNNCSSSNSSSIGFDAKDCSVTAVFDKTIDDDDLLPPDYIVANIELSPNSSIYTGGDSVKITANTYNQSEQAGKDYTIYWKIRKGEHITLNTGDILDEKSMNALGAYEEDQATKTVTLPNVDGRYYLGACVKMSGGQEKESGMNCQEEFIEIQKLLKKHSLKVIPTANGTVKLPETDSGTKAEDQSCSLSSTNNCAASDIPENTNVILNAIPDTTDDYIFLGWKNENGTSCLPSNELENPNPDFNITSNCEVSAEFGKDAEKEVMKEEIIDLKEEIKIVNEELDIANKQIDDLSKKIEKQEGDLEKLQNELEQVQNDSKKKDEKIEELQDQVADLIEKSKEVDDLKDKVAELEKALDEADKKHDEVVEKLEEELKEVKKKVEELKKEQAQRAFLDALIPTPSSNTRSIDYTSDLELSWKAGAGSEELFNQSTFTAYLKDEQETDIPLVGCDNLVPNQPCIVSGEQLNRDQTYVWGVDINGSEELPNATIWNFTTQSNTAPSKPTYIAPEQGKADINSEEDLNLSWNPSTDNDGDALKYDCYYRKVGDNTSQLCTLDNTGLQTEGFIKKDTLEHEAQYEWWVEVSDGNSQPVIGDTWNFSTISAPIGLTLEAISGYNSTLLEWTFTKDSFNNNDDIKYHILRTEKPDNTKPKDVVLNFKDHDISGVDGVNGANASCFDEGNATDEKKDTCNSSNTEVLERGKGYCYSVYAVVEGIEYKSNPACATFGKVILAIQDKKVNVDDDFITFPIYFRNAGNLKLLTADIVLEYNTDYLAFSNDENNSAIIQGDIEGFDTSDIGNFEVVPSNIGTGKGKLIFTIGGTLGIGNMPEELKGAGVFFKVKFGKTELTKNLAEDTEIDFTLHDASYGDASIEGIDGSIDFDVEKLEDFTLKKTKNRDSNTKAHITLTGAYFRGDVNGDSRKHTIDAFRARQIGVGIYEPTVNEFKAGKINADGLVNSNDARMIIYQKLHDGVWPDEIERQTRSRRNVRSDKAQDTVVLHLSDIQANSGEEVETTLSVDNLPDLAATNLVLVYDTSVIDKVLKVTRTGIANRASLVYHDNSTGLLRIGLDSQDPITGSGDIATIKLRLKTSDSITSKTSGLRIAHTLLYDVYGRNMSTSALQTRIEADNATITLNDIVEPEQPERQPAITPLPENDPSQQAIYSIIGKVVDSRGNAIHGVTISAGDKTTVTDDFFWILQDYTEGSYTVIAAKEGYSFEPQTCTLSGNQNCSVTFSTKPETSDNSDDNNGAIEEPTDPKPAVGDFQATITVLDNAGQGLPSTTIELSGESIATETYVTDTNGEVNISGLFEGKYTASILTVLDYVYKAKDFTVSSNTKHAKVYLKPSAPKFTVKTVITPTKPYEGDTGGVTYTAVITNNGENIATDITLTNTLPQNASFISAKVDAPEGIDAGSCSTVPTTGPVVTCSLMDLLPNESMTVTIQAMPHGTDTMVNVSQVESVEYPSHIDTLRTVIIPYFSVNAWVKPSPVLQGSHAIIKPRLQSNPNNTPTVDNILLTLNLPIGVEFVSYETENGNCQFAQQTLTCNLNPLATGEYADVDVTVESTVVGAHIYNVLAKSNFPDQKATRFIHVVSPLPATLENADIVIVLDITGSMDDNLEATKRAIIDLIEKAENVEVTPTIGLVTFKDNAEVAIVTKDLQKLVEKVDAIVPAGGDEKYFCREASVQAMIKGLDVLKPQNGELLIITDAPPHPDTDIDTAVDIMLARNTTFHALVAGNECNAAKFNAELSTRTTRMLRNRTERRRLRIEQATCDTTENDETVDMRAAYQCAVNLTGGTFTDHDVVNSGNEADIEAKQAGISTVLNGVLEKLNPSPIIVETPAIEPKPEITPIVIDENSPDVVDITYRQVVSTDTTPVVFGYHQLNIGSRNGRIVDFANDIDCDHDACEFLVKSGTTITLSAMPDEGMYLHLNPLNVTDKACFEGTLVMNQYRNCPAMFYGVPDTH